MNSPRHNVTVCDGLKSSVFHGCDAVTLPAQDFCARPRAREVLREKRHNVTMGQTKRPKASHDITLPVTGRHNVANKRTS